MDNSSLSLEHISHEYGNKPVLHDISFELGAGELVCLLGPSGCGKSTTLRLIAGLERPTRGRITLGGRTLFDETHFIPAEKRKIGMMFQDFALFPHMNILKNLRFAGASAQEANTLLDLVGLKQAANQDPHTLSGGEQQRVALARALAAHPDILLMDEPFSGLDDRLREQVRKEVFEIIKTKETPVVMVTHDPAEAMELADKIILLNEGRIEQMGTPLAIYNAPKTRFSAEFFSNINILTARAYQNQVTTVFGKFNTPPVEDGALMDLVIRPQSLRLDFERKDHPIHPTEQDGVAVRAHLFKARFLGELSHLEFQVDGLETRILVSLPGVFLPPKGQNFMLRVARKNVFIFKTKND